MCLGIALSSDVDEEASYSCPQCKVTDEDNIDMPTYLGTILDKSEQDLERAKSTLRSLEANLKKVYDMVSKEIGPIRSQLEESLAGMGVDKQAYHSQSFVGNHVQKLLKIDDKKNRPAELVSCFVDYPIEKQR
jgi:hypothetical protein